jgi:hypothetical protein
MIHRFVENPGEISGPGLRPRIPQTYLIICRGQPRKYNAVADGICAAAVEIPENPVSNNPDEIYGLEQELDKI